MPKENADLMKLLAEKESPSGGDPSAAPLGAPMSTPQIAEGDQAEAETKVALAVDLLSQALTPFGAESEKGKPIFEAVSKLIRAFGIKLDSAKKLVPAELKMLMEAAQMKSPEQVAAAMPPPQQAPAPPMMAA